MNNNGVISNGLSTTPFLIGVAGGTASGKVSSARVHVFAQCNDERVE